jgi:hypothetical protein
MEQLDTAIAILRDHSAAEAAIKKLAQGGFDLKSLSIVGKGYQSEERVTGFYNVGDRITMWGSRGAFWGGLWGLFVSGAFIATPVAGPVVVLGFLAGVAISALEGAIVVGGLSALGAALYSLGIPKDSILVYETEVTSDSFLVMVHGASDEVAYARKILASADARRVDVHSDAGSREAGVTPLVA